MPDTHRGVFLANSDGTMSEYATQGGSGSGSEAIRVSYDEATALYAHAVNDIIYVNSLLYKVTAAIAVGDTISTSTNVTATTGLAKDTQLYIDNLPGSSGEMSTAVSYEAQTLTDPQKAQARENISAAGLVPSATAGDIPVLKADGSTEDSGYKPSDLIQSNPNLLDNPFFTINQRGQSSYDGNIYGYDRWKGFNTTQTLTAAAVGISITKESGDVWLLGQKMNAISEPVTVTVKTSSGHHVFNFNNGFNNTSIYDNEVYVWLQSTGWILIGKRNEVSALNVQAVKLERGLVSTLANDVAPDYTIELLKCKRYFQRIQGRMYGTPRWLHFGMGAVMSATSANIALPIPTEFRAVPTISFHNGSNGFRLSQGSNVFATVTNMSIDTCTTSYVNIGVTCPSQTAVPVDSFCRLWSASADSYIDLSADL